MRLLADRFVCGDHGASIDLATGGAVTARPAGNVMARRVTWPEVKGREIEELDRLAPVAKAAAEGRAPRAAG